jgi:hypothetical protein
LRSFCNRPAIALRNRCAFALSSLRNCLAIILQSLRNRYAIVAQSRNYLAIDLYLIIGQALAPEIAMPSLRNSCA